MAIDVEVRERTHELVMRGRFSSRPGEDVVRVIADTAGEDVARFPLLAGVHPYTDTSFNEWQCERLVVELADLRRRLDDHRAAAVDELDRLARKVLVDGPGQAHFRQLVFVGD